MNKKGARTVKYLYFLLATAGLVILFILLITLPFIKKIYPNTYIAGKYVGNLNKSQGYSLLTNTIKTPEKIIFTVDGKTYEILTSEINLTYDFNYSINRAYNYPNKLGLIINPVNIGLKLNIDENKLKEALLIISSKSGQKPLGYTVKIINQNPIIDPGKNGVEIDIYEIENKILLDLSMAKNEINHFQTKETNTKLTVEDIKKLENHAHKIIGKEINLFFEDQKITLNDNDLIQFINPQSTYKEKAIINKLETISKSVNRNPQDSVFIVEGGIVKEFVSSKDGVTIDQDKLLKDIKNSLDSLLNTDEKIIAFQIPTIVYPAKIKNEDVNNLGIETLIGKGDSTFKGSITNRIYNVNLAQSKFKGILIPSGETVSFNNILGDVSSLTGYKSAYVIKDGKTILGDGGGVCQVSTTLFRALLNAGLPILERRAHAYRVGYYEQGYPPGLDATVYSPTTDLKFKNDTPAYILLQPTIDLTNLKLVFEIYGTNDGRTATITKPVITSQTAPPEDQYIDDPTLPLGTIKQIEHKAWGAKVVFNYKVTRNNETLIDQQFVSNYRAWGAVFLKGTKI